MPKVITVSSLKGGVGQTATVLNLGYSMSRLGPKVLVIDAAPQSGAGMASNARQKNSAGLLELLKGQAKAADVIVSAREGGLDFLGTGPVEAEEVIFFEKEAFRGNLTKIIRSVTEKYDYVFIDTATGLSVITYICMALSSSVIVPLAPNALAVKSLASMLKFFRRVRLRANRSLVLEGLLFTMTDHTSPYEVSLINDVRESFPPQIFFETVIPYDPAFEQANARATVLAMLPEGENAGRAYLDLAVEMRLREMAQTRKGFENGQDDGIF
ncbi:MAG: ParA family protein [Desulfatibacillaceae bacterium]|nr:ParA family protein [Desulfatibacillaceae bacterium]